MDFDIVLTAVTTWMAGMAIGALLVSVKAPAAQRTLADWIDWSGKYAQHTYDRLKGLPMRRKINIEIQANLSDNEYESLKNALKYSVRTILATTTLIGSDHPTVAMYGSDFFTNNEEIDVYVNDDEDEG